MPSQPVKTYASLDDLSPARKRLLGLAIAVVGAAAAWLVHSHPQHLHAPAWVAFAACACFVIAGTAVTLHSSLSPRAYSWAMVLLLATMASVPGWIALGPGERHCTSSVPLLDSERGCRIAFGLAALAMAGLLAIAVAQACKATNAAPHLGPRGR